MQKSLHAVPSMAMKRTRMFWTKMLLMLAGTGTNAAIAQFVVDASGQIRDAEILRSPDPRLNDPAIAAIECMPTMRPAQQKGKNVSVRYVLPIRFVLND